MDASNRRHSLAIGALAAVAALAVALGVLVVLGAFDGDDQEPRRALDAEIEFTPADQDPTPLVAGDPSGTAAPTAKFPRLGGGLGSIADYDGTPLVVNFFGSWCVPCRKEMPDIQAVHEELGDEVAFLGLAVNDSERDATAFVEEFGASYDMGRDPSGKIATELGVVNMPSTFVVSAHGQVVGARAGALTAEQLRKLIADAVDVS